MPPHGHHSVYMGWGGDPDARRRASEKRCLCYVRFFYWFLLGAAYYTVAGYICKWMWYHDDYSLMSYNVFDLEQLLGVVLFSWLCLGMYSSVRWYCPVCSRYSIYEKKSNNQNQFWCYQLGALIWVLLFWGIIELFAHVYRLH